MTPREWKIAYIVLTVWAGISTLLATCHGYAGLSAFNGAAFGAGIMRLMWDKEISDGKEKLIAPDQPKGETP